MIFKSCYIRDAYFIKAQTVLKFDSQSFNSIEHAILLQYVSFAAHQTSCSMLFLFEYCSNMMLV